MVTFSEKLKKVFILIAGPLGCYATYHYLFILRYLDHSKYPLLTDMYGGDIINCRRIMRDNYSNY